MLERGDKGPAARAPANMGDDHVALRFVKLGSRKRREVDVGGVRVGRHDMPPSRARSRASASRERDLTVPIGI